MSRSRPIFHETAMEINEHTGSQGLIEWHTETTEQDFHVEGEGSVWEQDANSGGWHGI